MLKSAILGFAILQGKEDEYLSFKLSRYNVWFDYRCLINPPPIL